MATTTVRKAATTLMAAHVVLFADPLAVLISLAVASLAVPASGCILSMWHLRHLWYGK